MKKVEVTCCADCILRCVDNDKSYCVADRRSYTFLPYAFVDAGKTLNNCPLLKEDYTITHKDKEKKK